MQIHVARTQCLFSSTEGNADSQNVLRLHEVFGVKENKAHTHIELIV